METLSEKHSREYYRFRLIDSPTLRTLQINGVPLSLPDRTQLEGLLFELLKRIQELEIVVYGDSE